MTAGFARLVTVAALVFVSAGVVSAQDPPRVTVVGNTKGPIKVTHVSPAYPDEAKAEKLSGTVRLDIVIATDGTVSEAELVDRVHPLLDESAAKAVRLWKYVATQVDGKPAEVAMSVSVTFVAPE